MKIALFSDIHANFPALEACLKNIEEQKADAVYCLGDMVGYIIWPNGLINEIRKEAFQLLPVIMILALEERVMIVVVLIKKNTKKKWVRFPFHLQTQ